MVDNEHLARIGAHVAEFAKKGGWKEGDTEGAFEFIQRTSYAQGLADGTAMRKEAQERLAIAQGRLARARLDLMKELRLQGWKPPGAEYLPMPRGWVLNHARVHPESDGVWQIGQLTEDGVFHEVITVDTGNYGLDEQAEPLAQAILSRIKTGREDL
jgi:hypothetical protein